MEMLWLPFVGTGFGGAAVAKDFLSFLVVEDDGLVEQGLAEAGSEMLGYD
jgi:hypothetical protein